MGELVLTRTKGGYRRNNGAWSIIDGTDKDGRHMVVEAEPVLAHTIGQYLLPATRADAYADGEAKWIRWKRVDWR